MKQAAIFICTFAVLFQLYAGASATDSSDDSSGFIYNVETMLEKFKANVVELANLCNATQYDFLIKAADQVTNLTASAVAKMEASNSTSAGVLEALKNVQYNMMNGSYEDSYATATVMSAFIYLVKTEIITSDEICEEFLKEVADSLASDDSSTTGSRLEIILAKSLAVLKKVYTTLSNAGSKNLSALIKLGYAIFNAILAEIDSTSNIFTAEVDAFLEIFGISVS